MKECDLSEPVSKWLKARGFRVFAEVPHYSSAIDLVGADLSTGYVVGVELKMGFTRKLLTQANLAKSGCHEAWACAPTSPSGKTIDIAISRGIGLLKCCNDKVVVITAPGLYRGKPTRTRERLLTRLQTHPEGGIGGKPQLKGEGPAQRVSEAVKAYIEENPNATWQEIFVNVPNHYAHARSMQGAMKWFNIRRK